MGGVFHKMRFAAAAVGLGLLALAPAAAQESPELNQQGNSLTPTQPELQELPSVADLADRLLPAVVEITIESKSTAATPQVPNLPGDENSPFKDFFDEFLKRQQGEDSQPRTMT